MSDIVERYLKDYSRNYLLIGGVPTSPFGVTLAKRCKWCYCVMSPQNYQSWRDKEFIKNEKGSVMRQIFCSPECKEEYEDWCYFRKLKRLREAARRYWRKKHPVVQKQSSGLTRKEYLKKYFIEHREKKREQARLAMQRYKARKRLNKK